MAEEKKPGFLKRIFSFGFGKKQAEPEETPDRDVAGASEAERPVAPEPEASIVPETEPTVTEVPEPSPTPEAELVDAKADGPAATPEPQSSDGPEIEPSPAPEAVEESREVADDDSLDTSSPIEVQQVQIDDLNEVASSEDIDLQAGETKPLPATAAEPDLTAEPETEEAPSPKPVPSDIHEDEPSDREEPDPIAISEVEDTLPPDPDPTATEEPDPVVASEIEEPVTTEPEQQQAPDPEPSPTPEPVEVGAENEPDDREQGWFQRLRTGLFKTSSTLTENIASVFTKRKLDEEALQDLEDILIQADLGVETAMNITDTLAAQRLNKDVTEEEVRQIMASEIATVLEPVAMPLELDLSHRPHVILVVGVNGSGKTTTIGKLSQKLYDAGHSTMLVAGDTFRAAAVEQLHIWGDRTNAKVLSRGNGADAAGLAFDAHAEAKKAGVDVMMMDTAGRLQNKKELMDELEKIIRVLKKQDETAPHTVLLTLDATTGQNALNQVEIFKDVAGVNGLVMTKLDGTARGGILVSIASKHKLPVYFIGVGEQVEDLEPFAADTFAKSIAGLE